VVVPDDLVKEVVEDDEEKNEKRVWAPNRDCDDDSAVMMLEEVTMRDNVKTHAAESVYRLYSVALLLPYNNAAC
jgi:hypothetical protein